MALVHNPLKQKIITDNLVAGFSMSTFFLVEYIHHVMRL